MASNLERLRAKKANNQKKEADLSTSFSIDEGEETSAKTEPVKEAEKAEEPAKITNPIRPITPIKETKPIKPDVVGSASAASSAEKNFGIRLSTEEDKRYLNMAPLARSMTKKAFFIEIMETACDETKNIDLTDPMVEKFRNSPLKTAPMTIAVPEDVIEKIKATSARHMMKYQRFVALTISQARQNDKKWQEIIG
ncbi:MAG: hypothetical protein K6B14_05115 [Lachnospiraceae bacterium]|nr:hypothetical protein [Lachnospiraceae bacterium]